MANLLTCCLRFLPQLAETRRDFVRIREDLETAAVKNAQVSRHRSGEAECATHLLLATRKCFQHFALDYCLQVEELAASGRRSTVSNLLLFQINSFQTQQRLDILNSVSRTFLRLFADESFFL